MQGSVTPQTPIMGGGGHMYGVTQNPNTYTQGRGCRAQRPHSPHVWGGHTSGVTPNPNNPPREGDTGLGDPISPIYGEGQAHVRACPKPQHPPRERDTWLSDPTHRGNTHLGGPQTPKPPPREGNQGPNHPITPPNTPSTHTGRDRRAHTGRGDPRGGPHEEMGVPVGLGGPIWPYRAASPPHLRSRRRRRPRLF